MRPVGRGVVALLLATLAVVVVLAVVSVGATNDAVTATRRVVLGDDGHRRTYVDDELVAFDGVGPERWAARARARRLEVAGLRRRLRDARRVMLSRPSVVEAINLAAATYGDGSTLWRVAGCETGGTFNPRAYNSSGASGLFQFMPSTFASTPYAAFSIWSPYASAMAAGFMFAHGRGGEWACR